MSIYKVENPNLISELVKNTDSTFICSYLQGFIGEAYTDDLENPKSARVIVGDMCFFVGEANAELVINKLKNHLSEFVIMIPQNKQWQQEIEKAYQEKAIKITRFSTMKDKNAFDKDCLQKIVDQLDEKYEIRLINEQLYDQIMSTKWTQDLCCNFESYQKFSEHGLGVVILHENKIISGASSYIYFDSGIEVEIDTLESFRRQGLALACGAKLILECLKRDLYPNWDAHTRHSLELAQKLGYQLDKEYVAYEINGY